MMAEDGEEDKEMEIPALPIELVGEILRHLSTFELLPALSVSAAWRAAAHFSAAARRRAWLFLHVQGGRRYGKLATHAYDPHAASWLKLPPPQTPSSAVGAVAGADFLFELTPAALAVRGRSLGAPLAWRRDPVVAVVGSLLVIAGGGLDGDSCAVEVHRIDGGGAAAAAPMPESFRASASATFLSAAAGRGKVHVLDRSSGVFCSFDAETRRWGPERELRPDPSLSFSAIAFSDETLLLAGVGMEDGAAARLRLWAVEEESLSCTLVGEMPERMAGKLIGDGEDEVSSIDVIAGGGGMVYIYKPGDPTVVFAAELGGGGGCRWTEVQVPAAAAGNYPMDRFVFTCSMVGMEELEEVFREEKDC